ADDDNGAADDDNGAADDDDNGADDDDDNGAADDAADDDYGADDGDGVVDEPNGAADAGEHLQPVGLDFDGRAVCLRPIATEAFDLLRQLDVLHVGRGLGRQGPTDRDRAGRRLERIDMDADQSS